MTCFELAYQQRVYRVMVKLRLAGWSTDEVATLADVALYEEESVLANWERYVDVIARTIGR